MCYLVSYVSKARSDAERSTIQVEEFQDSNDATNRAEALIVSDNAREVKLWRKIGEPKAKVVVDWTNGEKG